MLSKVVLIRVVSTGVFSKGVSKTGGETASGSGATDSENKAAESENEEPRMATSEQSDPASKTTWTLPRGFCDTLKETHGMALNLRVRKTRPQAWKVSQTACMVTTSTLADLLADVGSSVLQRLISWKSERQPTV